MQLSCLEAAHPSARVGQREEQTPGEVIVSAPVRETCTAELVGRETLFGGATGEGSAAGGQPEAELAADLLA